MRWILPFLIITACQPQVTPTEELERTVKSYSQHIRWKRFAKAAAYVPAEERQAFLDAFEPSEDQLNVDDFEVKNVELDDTKVKGKVTVEAKFFKLPSISLQKARATQTWEKRGEAWWLVSNAEVPFFTDASSQPASTPAKAPSK